MARSTVSAQCDLVASYMDGVHVKIAEAYKPPRKVCLPAAYNNKLPDVSKLSYDFSLERSVLEKMTEWRTVRQANNKARHARLDEKKMREKKEFSPPPPPPLPDMTKQLPVNAPAPETTILTPQPLSPPPNDLQDHVKTNGLDFADFDNDTSSPFDNMELKTINDMEELAQVLQPTSQWVPLAKLESILNDLTVDDQSDVHIEEKSDNTKNETNDQEEETNEENVKHRSVSTIVQELQRDLERPLKENWKPWSNLESCDINSCETKKQEEPMVSNQDTVMNLLQDLTEEDKKLAHHLSDMGFPLSKAARAIRDLGGQDNKKIVEYLLAVQSLEEAGISGEDAEKALALTECNQEKAKAYHENLCTLRDLGFPEEEASAALLKCNIDRDRALDFLIA
ncbi:ubiquitin-associated protein 1 [Hylaeus volcanicus]|uniref:ubiquitin-associated protein 1 n=1 Tax=Hylaeus volcanicus TaxID=313075 RepID=UPI0023B788DB|nr:ubiquitin-associated protein 1 [Hylaeus volcanicus]